MDWNTSFWFSLPNLSIRGNISSLLLLYKLAELHLRPVCRTTVPKRKKKCILLTYYISVLNRDENEIHLENVKDYKELNKAVHRKQHLRVSKLYTGQAYSLSYWIVPDYALHKIVTVIGFLGQQPNWNTGNKMWLFLWSLLWTWKRTNLTWGYHFSGRDGTSRLYGTPSRRARKDHDASPVKVVWAAVWVLRLCAKAAKTASWEPQGPSPLPGWAQEMRPENRRAHSKFPPNFLQFSPRRHCPFLEGGVVSKTLMLRLKTKFHNPWFSG